MPTTSPSTSGLTYALAAFGWWGFGFPLFLLALNYAQGLAQPAGPDTPSRWHWALEISAHRIVWSLVVCALLLRGGKVGLASLRSVLSLPIFGWLVLSSLLIAINWGGFALGAVTERLNQASFGYYINPLVSVALGMFFFGERLRWLQWVAVSLAAAGVACETYNQGQVPAIALAVAFSFGLYGLIRKRIPVGSLAGFTIETALLVPLAFGYLLWRWLAGPELAFGQGWLVTLLLVSSGVATAAPLIWFGNAAQRLPLSTIGFLQYITPTGQLFIAVWFNGEHLLPGTLLAFGFIWLGIAVFLIASSRRGSHRVLARQVESSNIT